MASDVVHRREKSGSLTAPELDKIERAGVPAGAIRLTIKDTDVRGLELRLTPTGARSWAISRRVNGAQRRFTISSSGRMGLADARKAARILLGEVERGVDPIAQKKAERERHLREKAGIGQPWKLGELIDEFGAKKARGQRTWDERRAHMRREYAELLDVPVSQITRGRIREVLDAAIARRASISGRHGLRYLRTIMRWAVRNEKIAADPTAGIELRDVPRERRRDRVLSADELARLWRTLEADPHNVYSQILRMLLLTGQRLGEVAGMCWQDVNLDRREWLQPTNKSDRPHLVPLSEAAAEIVASRPYKKGALVFTTTTGGGLERGRGNWGRATVAYGKAAGVTGWTRHDLRRTAATILASLKVDRGVIELLLNHAESAGKGGMVAAIYNRHSYDLEKRQAVEKLAEHIRRMADGAAARVVEMRQAVS